MLVRLLYASRAVDDVSQEELMTILSQSKAHNPASGITGVLCSSGRLFLQLLEGGRMQVNALYNQIAADARHKDVVILSYEEISEVMDCSLGTVMSRLHYARKKLQAKLKELL